MSKSRQIEHTPGRLKHSQCGNNVSKESLPWFPVFRKIRFAAVNHRFDNIYVILNTNGNCEIIISNLHLDVRRMSTLIQNDSNRNSP